MTKEEYAEYLQSERWKEISRYMRDRFNCCQRCLFPHELNVHHKTYERLGAERIPDDLIVLCRSCHSREHFMQDAEKMPELAGGKEQLEEAKKRLETQRRDSLWKNFERKIEVEKNEDTESC